MEKIDNIIENHTEIYLYCQIDKYNEDIMAKKSKKKYVAVKGYTKKVGNETIKVRPHLRKKKK